VNPTNSVPESIVNKLMAISPSRRLAFKEIPVIDLSSLVSGKKDHTVVEDIGRACREVGFLYVKNHGIPERLIQDMVAAGREFFERPLVQKKAVLLDTRIRGYLPLGYRSYEGESIAATSNQEGFWIGPERPLTSDNRLDGPNLWPRNSQSLRNSLEEYYKVATGLAIILQKSFALALGLPESFFSELFVDQSSLLKINHYPPQDNPTTISNIGVVPHADEGGFTILWQDSNGGLEVESKGGEWVVAPPIEGTFVINLGDTMQIWTNGEFSSTRHRVINRSGVDRYSIPFFANPRWNVPVKPLLGSGRLKEMVEENFEMYQSRHHRRIFPIAFTEERPGNF
tara:strand:+ start:1777 stop:2799 length:1023 start_codon:yes stop_codon:yes gene_type:complete